MPKLSEITFFVNTRVVFRKKDVFRKLLYFSNILIIVISKGKNLVRKKLFRFEIFVSKQFFSNK